MVLSDMKKQLFFYFFSFILSVSSFSQIKIEREFKIQKKEVPKPAVSFIDSIKTKHIKWYKEINEDRETYEAKFHFKGKEYSIEFDTTGKIYDVEFIISTKSIASHALKKITTHLDSTFQNWKFEKIQLQYTGSEKALMKSVKNGTEQDIQQIYEIVIDCNDNGTFKSYEYTFNTMGEKIEQKEIIEPQTIHLDY